MVAFNKQTAFGVSVAGFRDGASVEVEWNLAAHREPVLAMDSVEGMTILSIACLAGWRQKCLSSHSTDVRF